MEFREKSIERVFQSAQSNGDLDISSRNLKNFPQFSSEFDLRDTVTIDMSSNSFTVLPSKVGDCKYLEELVCKFNLIKSIPPCIGALKNLTYLNLHSNQMSVWPTCLSQISSLEILVISHNRFTCLPDDIAQMSSLLVFDISDNELTHLTKSIGSLRKLEKLNLRSNQLDQLPDELCNITGLRSLDIRSNRITRLPIDLRKMYFLESLLVDENPLIMPHMHASTKGHYHIIKALHVEALREERQKGQKSHAELQRSYIKSLRSSLSSSESFRSTYDEFPYYSSNFLHTSIAGPSLPEENLRISNNSSADTIVPETTNDRNNNVNKSSYDELQRPCYGSNKGAPHNINNNNNNRSDYNEKSPTRLMNRDSGYFTPGGDYPTHHNNSNDIDQQQNNRQRNVLSSNLYSHFKDAASKQQVPSSGFTKSSGFPLTSLTDSDPTLTNGAITSGEGTGSTQKRTPQLSTTGKIYQREYPKAAISPPIPEKTYGRWHKNQYPPTTTPSSGFYRSPHQHQQGCPNSRQSDSTTEKFKNPPGTTGSHSVTGENQRSFAAAGVTEGSNSSNIFINENNQTDRPLQYSKPDKSSSSQSEGYNDNNRFNNSRSVDEKTRNSDARDKIVNGNAYDNHPSGNIRLLKATIPSSSAVTPINGPQVNGFSSSSMNVKREAPTVLSESSLPKNNFQKSFPQSPTTTAPLASSDEINTSPKRNSHDSITPSPFTNNETFQFADSSPTPSSIRKSTRDTPSPKLAIPSTTVSSISPNRKNLSTITVISTAPVNGRKHDNDDDKSNNLLNKIAFGSIISPSETKKQHQQPIITSSFVRSRMKKELPISSSTTGHLSTNNNVPDSSKPRVGTVAVTTNSHKNKSEPVQNYPTAVSDYSSATLQSIYEVDNVTLTTPANHSKNPQKRTSITSSINTTTSATAIRGNAKDSIGGMTGMTKANKTVKSESRRASYQPTSGVIKSSYYRKPNYNASSGIERAESPNLRFPHEVDGLTFTKTTKSSTTTFDEKTALAKLRQILSENLDDMNFFNRKDEDFLSTIAEGVVLCYLCNTLASQSVETIRVPDKTISLEHRRENLQNFLNVCKKFGLDQTSLCSEDDIIRLDPTVLPTIISRGPLARDAEKRRRVERLSRVTNCVLTLVDRAKSTKRINDESEA